MNYIAIVDWTTDNRVAKYMDFETEPEAQKHANRVRSRYPKAFVARNPGGGFTDWLVDSGKKILSISPLPKPPPPPPDDSEVVTQALVDKGVLTLAELDAARTKLQGSAPTPRRHT